ncbi:hypothetical protein ACFVOK_12285 [Streptomyces sp. NPDC057798]|uniref:hypothetical protein n=1 Tax=Streptomyces TaxID=1883 RepID=UPI00131CB4D1|nr:hypothetical protein [Streptomyces bicolor]
MEPTVEPELDHVTSFDIRRADSDVDGFVTQVLGLLASGVTLVDVSHHDHRGTAIELRAQSRRTSQQ